MDLRAHPIKAVSLWERDLGPLTEDQWEKALQSISTRSLNVAQKVFQLYIVLRVHYTPKKLHRMGRLVDPCVVNALGILSIYSGDAQSSITTGAR